MYVRKRNGDRVPFDKSKIEIAINKAMHSSNGVFVEGQAKAIADEIYEDAKALNKELSIYDRESQTLQMTKS